MDTARYVVALVLTAGLLPIIVFWLVIHPLADFWRRLGAWWGYGIGLSVMAAGAAGLFLARESLLEVDLGTSPVLVITGIALLVASAVMRSRIHRDFPVSMLVGLPELAPEKHPGMLITSGIYGRVRHPRYMQMAVGVLGMALFANFVAAYVSFAAWLVGIAVVVRLEERELRNRFGGAFDEYCRRVPRFVPRYVPTDPSRP